MFCLCVVLSKFWFQADLRRENIASYYRQGRQLLLTFLTMVTCWSRSTSNFYALIGQIGQVSSCGKFMQHFETGLLLQLKLTQFCVNLWCFNCLFPLDVQNEIQLLSRIFINGWFVYWVFGWKIRRLSKSEVASFSFFAFQTWFARGLKSLKRFWPNLIAFRTCTSNGKPE